MNDLTGRLGREARTIHAMIRLYCRAHHPFTDGICSDCHELNAYALDRLRYCPYGLGKTTCQNCPVHCYNAAMKEQIRVVMRYAGPHMLLRHPYLTLRHFWDKRREAPESAGEFNSSGME